MSRSGTPARGGNVDPPQSMLANERLLIPAALFFALGPPACRGSAPPPDGGDAAPSASHAHVTEAPSAPASAPAHPLASGSAAPSAGPATPIAGALPTSAPHGLDRRAECVKEGCTLPHLVPDEVRPALSDGAPMVVWEQVIGERSTLVFPRDEVVELEGVVLEGSVDAHAHGGPEGEDGRRAAGRASARRAAA